MKTLVSQLLVEQAQVDRMNHLRLDTIDEDGNKASLSFGQDFDEVGIEAVEEAAEDASIAVEWEEEPPTKDLH